jgi:hypothetical protein
MDVHCERVHIRTIGRIPKKAILKLLVTASELRLECLTVEMFTTKLASDMASRRITLSARIKGHKLVISYKTT